jgi:hypothetical protein
MATGITKLSRIQWVKEVTPGTPVATATTRWRGAGAMLDDQRKVEEIEEMMGIIDGADRTAVVQLLGMLNLADTPLTAEQLQYLMVMGMGGPTTGAADGAGSDKIYVTNVPTTAKATATPYTIQGGDDFEVEQMEYAVCTKISIKGAMGQTCKMGGTLMGRQVARLAGGFTAAAIPAVGEFPCQKGKLYMDAIGGAYGATQVSTTLLAFQVDLELHWIPVFTMDGNLYFAYPSYTGHKISGSLTYLHDTPSDGNTGAMLDFRNQTPKLMRIDLSGDAVTSPGTLYSTKKVLIDLPVKLLNPGPLGNDNGNAIYTFKFRSRYSTTAGNAGKFTVVPELTPLT